MQPEPSEILPETPVSPSPADHASPRQYGLDHEGISTPVHSPDEQHGSSHSSGSEWSLSPSRQSPSDTSESWLTYSDVKNAIVAGSDVRSPIARRGSGATLKPDWIGVKKDANKSNLHEFPEEMLFQVLSHLSATDLLSVKLVSRRFCNLVNSPHAWMNAFSKYFPGPNSLKSTADVTRAETNKTELRSEKREFTRLTPNPSWTSEYLLRTKLLRCLARGRPSIPFAAPSPGKPGKGYATFTYSSRLWSNATHMQAKFGSVLDKRLPQFIHGLSTNGRVTTSDKRGKFDGWGIMDQTGFQTFSFLYPGVSMWGLGAGELVGVPNVMDLSQSYGMIYGEGTPGGNAFYLSTDEKRGRYLSSFLNISRPQQGIPRISPHFHSTTCVWIAKSANVPRLTRGTVGMMSGSSAGTVSAYSLGSFGDAHPRLQRGELTMRWLLSPGIPIIAIAVDEFFTQDRALQGRIWAVALNALGELFVLHHVPTTTRNSSIEEADLEQTMEVRAWQTGATAIWSVVKPSKRSEKSSLDEPVDYPSYYLKSVWDGDGSIAPGDDVLHFEQVQSWIDKRPIDLRTLFQGWDMRRRLEVDFGCDQGRDTGEAIFVFNCGLDEETVAGVNRYVRYSSQFSRTQSSATNLAKNSEIVAENYHDVRGNEEWRSSQYLFGRYKNIRITATAMDCSTYSTMNKAEDDAIANRKSNSNLTESVHDSDAALKLPGQRARLIAAGTGAGSIFVWNSRVQVSGASNFTNSVSPVRIIHTDSPEISSLALTSLYLVHGGSEGLVQAWDPLASTMDPIRTISSRTTLNARRRAVIASQTNPAVQTAVINSYAASAICLDPDPTVLRGIVAIGSLLRYWSYSSTSAKDEMSKSQKRKMTRARTGLNASPGEKYMGTRRLGLKEFVHEEMVNRELDAKVERAEAKEQRRVASRFGVDLLGPDASEEEMLAYAKLLSEEDNGKNTDNTSGLALGPDMDESQIAAVQDALSEEDREKWKYASWDERSTIAAPVVNSVIPAKQSNNGEDDIEKAIKLSLEETQLLQSPSVGSDSTNSTQDDENIAKAIHLSLNEALEAADSKTPTQDQAESAVAEDDLAEAIRRSLQENSSSPVGSSGSTPASISYSDSSPKRDYSEEEFPALQTSSPRTSPSPGTPSWGKGKGKKRGF